jgi:hypothetical protein
MGAVVTVGNGAEAGGQCEFTIAYQDLCSRSEPHWCFWFGGPGDYHRLPWPCVCRRTPFGWSGSCYQSLPVSGSGSTPAAGDLYQSLPPRRGTRHRCECRGRGSLAWQSGKCYVRLERWHTVENTQGESERWWSVSKRFFFFEKVGRHAFTTLWW